VIDALTEKMNGKTSKHRCVLPTRVPSVRPRRAGARFLGTGNTLQKSAVSFFFRAHPIIAHTDVTLLTPPFVSPSAHTATSARSRRSLLLTAVSSRRPCTSSPWRRARTTRDAPPSSSSV
jgi:hypothetical protein